MIHPEMKYQCIFADPNWSYQNWSEVKNGAQKAHYEGSSSTEISKIPVSSWAKEDAVLALWATLPKLPEALEVLEAWGFRYVTAIPWMKTVPEVERIEVEIASIRKSFAKVVAWVKNLVRRGIGFWTQGCCELLLIGTRGTPKPKASWSREKTPLGLLTGESLVFWHPIGAHSKKPEGLQSYFEEKFDGPFLELYATRPRTNWECWGFNTGRKLSERGVEPFTADSYSRSGHAQEDETEGPEILEMPPELAPPTEAA